MVHPAFLYKYWKTFLLISIITAFTGNSKYLLAKNLYISSTFGNDNYSATQAQHPETPWKSIEKLNASMNLIDPGDSILFKRGDTFRGQINLIRSGNMDAQIVFGAYGNGPKPVISGTTYLTGWTKHQGNIWVTTCPDADTLITGFFINGTAQQLGRYPNTDALNSGFLTIESHSDRSTISCATLNALPNWTGGDAIIKTVRWVMDQVNIKSHSGNTLTFREKTTYEINNRYGFFIQNHINTLDKEGEWYFDAESKKCYLFLSSDPNEMLTEATVFSYNFRAINRHHIEVSNFQFTGSVLSAIHIIQSQHFSIKSNEFDYAGNSGIIAWSCNNLEIKENFFTRINNNAVYVGESTGVNVSDNLITRIGLIPGMGYKPTYTALSFTGVKSLVCDYNKIDSTGYNGIFFIGDAVHIRKNRIMHFCMTIDDGGGIYTCGDGKDTKHLSRTIENNIILNGIGAGAGTDNINYRAAEGIYIDSRSDNVTILENTVANCANHGLFIQNSNNITILNNTVYNNHTQVLFRHSSEFPEYPIYGCLVKNNIFFSLSDTQLVAEFRTIKNDIPSFGEFDNNLYCRPLHEDLSILTAYVNNTTSTKEYVNLTTWKELFGHDQHSLQSPLSISPFYVQEFFGSNKLSNGTFEDNTSGWSCWSANGNCRMVTDRSILEENCLKLDFSPPSGQSNADMIAMGNIGNITANETYVLRFSMLASKPNKRIRVALQKKDAPYTYLADIQQIIVDDNRNEYELEFKTAYDETVSIVVFTIPEDGTVYWLDNVELFRARTEQVKMEDKVVFYYNETRLPVSYSDKSLYMDIRKNKYQSVSVSPFNSVILFKVSTEFYNNLLPKISISSIEITTPDGSTIIPIVGGNMQLYPIITPADATDPSVTWFVLNNTGKALIDQSGLVTSLMAGLVTIMGVANDGSGTRGAIELAITGKDVSSGSGICQSTSAIVIASESGLFINFRNHNIDKGIKVYNVNGQLYKSLYTSNDAVEIYTGDIPAGLYFIQILEGSGEMHTYKIMKP